MAAAGPLKIETVVDRVHAVLRERILDGELPRGARLRQETIAEELGVSRTPLREALRRLAAEGFVEFTPNRGAQVADARIEDVRAAYEVRMIVEPEVARLAALRRPPDDLAAMREAIARQRRSRDPAAASQASRAFHLALVRASGNPYLVVTLERLWVAGLGRRIYEVLAPDSDLVAADAVAHERIADAVEAGEPDLAADLTARHVQSALATLVDPAVRAG